MKDNIGTINVESESIQKKAIAVTQDRFTEKCFWSSMQLSNTL